MNKKIDPRELSSSSSYIESVDHTYEPKDSLFLKNINNPEEIKMPRKRDMAKSLGKSIIKTGDRSEKIRTYNFPQDRCTDHRSGITINNLNKLLSGNLEDFIQKNNDIINK